MKKLLLSVSVLLLAGLSASAQAPELLNYQGVARDSSGAPLANIPIGLNLIIHDGSETGPVVYQETQTPTTNNFGLYNVAIGSGTTTYALGNVAWGSGAKYMEVQIDPAGGTSYTSIGVSRLLSVPYALYAASADVVTDTTLAGSGTSSSPLKIAQHGATTGQVLEWDGSAWVPATSNAWTISGNTGTNSGTDFIGTRDTAALRFRVNNIWAGELNVNTGNVSYGPGAGKSNTTGYNNTASGDSALYSNTTGFSNTATGINALKRNTTGVWNVAMGEGALAYATNDSENTAIGAESLNSNTTGNENTAIGVIALNSNTTGKENSALGEVALYYNTTGSANTAVGGYALETNTTGTFNTAVGYAAGVSADTLTNATALGSYAMVNADNKVVVGATTVTTIGGYTSWTNLSDGRFKTDIKENVPGLSFINKLKPVTYRFEARKFEQFLGRTEDQKRKASFDDAEAQVRTGFIAQEVEKAAQESGYDFSGIHKPKNEKDNYSLAYSEFTVPLVKAVQELSAQNEALQKQVAELMKRVEDLEKK